MKKKSIKFYLIVSISLILLIVGVTYAASFITIYGKENKINTGIINFNFTEGTTGLNIQNNEGVDDEIAKTSNQYFEFKVSASGTGKIDVGYYVYLTPDNANDPALNNYVKYYLTNVVDQTETPVIGPALISDTIPFNTDTIAYDEISSNRLIHTGYYSFNDDSTLQSTTYRYRMWLDSSYEKEELDITENGEGSHIISTTKTIYKVKINVLGVDGKPVTITKTN